MRLIRISFLVVLSAACLTAVGSHVNLVPKAKASHGCSLKTLHGNYGGVWAGLLYPGSPQTTPQPITAFQPLNAMETSYFDGAGSFASNVVVSVGGTPAQTFPDSGTYTINSTCTGTLTLVSGLTFDFLVLHGGREVKFIDTDGIAPAAITEARLDADEE